MKVFVTGSSGQLGHDVCRELARRGIPYCGTSSRELNITDREAVRRAICAYQANAVIHCAAYTNVEQAEKYPEQCWAVNVCGTQNVAEACREISAKLLYISTDYVFSGEGSRFYAPDAPACPINVYGRSKLEGELVVKELLHRWFVVRTSWAFGTNGSNFVKSILRLSRNREELQVVCDQIGRPTYTVDLASLLCTMVGTDCYGTYHAVNAGVCSRAEFAREIIRQAGCPVRVRETTSARYGGKVRRPLNSRMSTASLEAAGFFKLPPWQDALTRYMKEEGLISG